MSSAGSKDEKEKSATQTETTNETPPAGGVSLNVAVEPITPPENPPPEETDTDEIEEQINELGERVTAAERSINEGLTGERQWTTTALKAMQQELSDLKANLTQLATTLPQQYNSLREELTRLLQERQRAAEALETVETVITETPPESPPNAEGEGPEKTGAQPQVSQPTKRKPRVL